MRLDFAERADVAYHSLSAQDQKRIQRTLASIKEADTASLAQLRTLKRFPQTREKALWILRVSPQLRLIASIKEGTFTVEDIVPRDRLDRIVGKHSA